ncbi:sulfotransferase 1A1-like [Littorina saxatilis]|uniref:Sulfotransferase domain-containing protein n=1 Tax=Littorina saxatilis TaxID=31220 RepID=A0AAN9G6P3_9CAEN
MTTVKLTDKSGCSLTVIELDGKFYPAFPVDNLKNYRTLPLTDDDVILCAYPKSGTHWLWEVAMMLRQGKAETIPFKKSLQMVEFNSIANMAEYPPPRVFNTHVLYEDLPSEAHARRSRLVLVYRNPKDVAVSLYNHHRKLSQYYEYEGTFADWLEMFLDGRVDYGSWFDYVKSWEKVFYSDAPNPVHLIKYEDMKENPVSEIKRLAEFLGVTPDPELIKKIADKCEFSKMAEDKKPHQEHTEIMFRKGVVGDWKNTFTVAQSEAFDAILKERMKDCKLKLQVRYTL